MGQAALKYDEFDELDQVPIPEGGIATFLTAETGSWADDDDDVPPKGITNVVKIADKLAEYGRNEDEYMVHAAEGETVIPMEVFKQNPALKDKLFAEMRIMGIEPERYVVGNELNSINPVTGQPEFFLKKLFRGLKKVVKAVLPVVAKVVLTVALGGNYVAASAIVDGATAVLKGGSLKDGLKAAAIGGISAFAGGKIAGKAGWAAQGAKQMATEAAINTALSGGKPKDILKSAAIAGATTKGMDFLGGKLAPAGADATATIDPAYAKELAATNPAELARLQGIEGVTVPSQTATVTRPDVAIGPEPGPVEVVTGSDARGPVQGTATQGVQGTATQGVQGPATDPLASLGDLSDLGYSDAAFGQPVDPATAARMEIGQTEILKATDPNAFNRQQLKGALERQGVLTDTQIQSELDATYPLDGTSAPGAGTVGVTDTSGQIVPSVGESLRTVFGGKDVGLGERFSAVGDIFLPKPNVDRLMEAMRLENPADYAKMSDAALRKIAEKQIATGVYDPGFLRKYGPGAAAVLGLSALSKPEEVESINIDDIPTGMDLLEADPSAYRIFDDDRTYNPARFTITRAAGADFGAPAFRPTPIDLPPLGVAEGGEIMNFPRMNGPIEGPGTETSDDIPAMLSDGEFVFTAKAVRGAGRGSREDGMKNMYNMMRQFEARV
jgi:hypothetical protein